MTPPSERSANPPAVRFVYIVGPAVTALATVAALAWLLSTQPL